jgi:hypothetical protein
MNEFVGGFGANPEFHVGRAIFQKDLLGQLFMESNAELEGRCKSTVKVESGRFCGFVGPAGDVFVDYELTEGRANEVSYVCYFYDMVRGDGGLSPRRLYALILHPEGRWSDSTGKELSYDFMRDCHKWPAIIEIVARVLRAQVWRNTERLSDFLKSPPQNA